MATPRDEILQEINKKEYKEYIMKDIWGKTLGNLCCKTCFYYAPKKPPLGRCRRHAPTMKGFPVVYETDWCGDHKLARLEMDGDEYKLQTNANA